MLILPHPKLYFPTLACSQKHNRIHNIDNVKAAIKVLGAGHGWKTRFASSHLWAPSFEDGQNQLRTPPFQRPAIAYWRKEITLTWGRIQYPAMSPNRGTLRFLRHSLAVSLDGSRDSSLTWMRDATVLRATAICWRFAAARQELTVVVVPPNLNEGTYGGWRRERLL